MGGRLVRGLIALVAAMMLASGAPAVELARAQEQALTIIAHRGASGERPEHTLAAYDRAIAQGADFIEPDLVVTKDGVLVARHENEISGTTDVAGRPEFADRHRAKLIDGQEVSGWFAEDFTLAELRTLRARERLPDLRPASAREDGLYQVPTLAEIISLARAREAETGRPIGLYPELKHPAFLASQGHDVVQLLVDQLHAAGYRSASDPVFIQCFEVAPLVRLAGMTQLRLIQLVTAQGGPADTPGASYDAMLRPVGLARIAEYAAGVGPEIALVLAPDGSPAPLAEQARQAGLAVHVWTLRQENAFLPADLRMGQDAASPGDMRALFGRLRAAGVDGIFTDHPGPVVRWRAED